MKIKFPIASFIILVTAGLVAFSPILRNRFVWDDDDIIVGDRFIKSARNWLLFFRPSHWQQYYPGDYRPLRSLFLAFNYLFWKLNPFGYHFSNLLLHILNCLLLYRLLGLLVNNQRCALVGAIIFLLYPLHAEAVAWAKNCSELISAFFFLAAFFFVLGTADGQSSSGRGRERQRKLLSLACFILALLSKSSAIVLPLLLVWGAVSIRAKKPLKKNITGTWPFWVIAAGYLTFSAIFLPRGETRLIAPPPLTLGERILIVEKTLASYLKLLLFPFPSSAERLLPHPSSLAGSAGFLACLALAAYIIFAFRFLRGAPRLAFFLLWPLVTLLPVSNIILLASRPLAEQRLYLPSAGIGAAIACCLAAPGRSIRSKRSGAMVELFTIFLVLLFFWGSYFRNHLWADEISLFASTLRSSPSLRIRLNLANAYLHYGQRERALNECVEILQINPAFAEARATLSQAYEQAGFFEQAIAEMEKARSLSPEQTGILNNLGLLYIRRGRWQEARDAFLQALRYRPDNIQALNNLANCYHHCGDLENARRIRERILKIDPANPVLLRQPF